MASPRLDSLLTLVFDLGESLSYLLELLGLRLYDSLLLTRLILLVNRGTNLSLSHLARVYLSYHLWYLWLMITPIDHSLPWRKLAVPVITASTLA